MTDLVVKAVKNEDRRHGFPNPSLKSGIAHLSNVRNRVPTS